MKTSKKVLSILLSVLMIFSIIPMTAFAEAKTAEQFISNENLCVLAEDLLKALSNRVDKDLGTILRFVFTFVDNADMKKAIGTTDIGTASDEKLADILVAYLNTMLADVSKDIPSIVSSLVKLLGITLDLKNIDGAMVTLESVVSNKTVKGALGGDIELLSAEGLTKKNAKGKTVVVTTKNGFTNKEIVSALFSWLSADGQIKLIKELLMGTLNIKPSALVKGLLKDAGVDEAIDDINKTMKELPKTIKALIYDIFCEFVYTEDAEGSYKMLDNGDFALIAEDETVAKKYKRSKVDFEKSHYIDFTADDLLAAAFLNLFKSSDKDLIDKSEATAAAKLTFYQILGKYAEKAIDMYALEPINGQFKNWLKNDVAVDPNYAFMNDAINWDYNVTAKSFNLDDVATKGIASKLNTIVYGFLTAVFNAATIKEIGLEDGDNSKLQGNLDRVVKWFISKIPAKYEGYDWTEVKKVAATNTLEQNAVVIVTLFFKDWFGAEYVVPSEINSLEELGAYAVFAALDKFVVKRADKYPDWKFGNYKDQIFGTDGKILKKTDAEWIDTLLTIGLDVAVYALNKNNKSTGFVLTPDQAVAYKNEGWTYEYFLDEIVDWGINYIKGFPAIADELSSVRGKYDGFGPFYKLNVVLNKMLPLSFFTGCDDGYFPFDTKTVVYKLLGDVLNFDFASLISILDVNDNEGNPLNIALVPSVLAMAENLIFSIFKYDASVGKDKLTLAATETADGYEYVKGSVDKFYRVTKTIAAAPAVTGLLGDPTGDGRINTKDAKEILKFSAKLITFTDEQFVLADVTKDGRVNTKDAKEILKFTAKLPSVLTA